MDEVLPSHERAVVTEPDGAFSIRELVPDDADRYFRLIDESCSNSKWMEHGAEVAKSYPDLATTRQSIENPPNTEKIRFGIWVTIDGEERMVGSVNIRPYHGGGADTYETGSWIGAAFEGNGYVKRARNLLIQYAFENLRVQKLVSFIDERNERSWRSVESSGYERVSAFQGECEYELTRDIYERLHGEHDNGGNN